MHSSIYIYIYIYVCVCVCVCVCEEKLTTNRKWGFIEKRFGSAEPSSGTVRGFISDVKCRWMYKKCKNI